MLLIKRPSDGRALNLSAAIELHPSGPHGLLAHYESSTYYVDITIEELNRMSGYHGVVHLTYADWGDHMEYDLVR